MSNYCVKCGKEIKETSPDNGLYCRDCLAAGKQELTLPTNDPRERQISPAPRNNTRSGGYDQQVGYRPDNRTHYSRTAPPPKNNSKRIAVIIVCVLVAAAAVVAAVFYILRDRTDTTPATKQAANTEVNQINLRERLDSLIATDKALGLSDKFSSFDDINDGFVDTVLVGTWESAFEGAWTFSEDGTCVRYNADADAERFICITVGAYKVICVEEKETNGNTAGNAAEPMKLSYWTYEIDNDVLFKVKIPVSKGYSDSSYTGNLDRMYRRDENGSADAAMAENIVSPDTFTGTWASETGEFTVADGKLTLGEDVFDISVNEWGHLVVTSGGSASEYFVNFSVSVQYDDENLTDVMTGLSMYLSYYGEDENDKPNLLPVLKEQDGDYSADFYLQ